MTHYSIWPWRLAVTCQPKWKAATGNRLKRCPLKDSTNTDTAATLVDQMPDETSCLSSFLVIAHTTDDNIYWISEVASFVPSTTSLRTRLT